MTLLDGPPAPSLDCFLDRSLLSPTQRKAKILVRTKNWRYNNVVYSYYPLVDGRYMINDKFRRCMLDFERRRYLLVCDALLRACSPTKLRDSGNQDKGE